MADPEIEAALKASLQSAGGGSGATETLTRDAFVAGVCAILRLAIDGTEGVLHSTRVLRNLALQRTNGEQDVAGRRVVEALGQGVADDDQALVAACVPATANAVIG